MKDAQGRERLPLTARLDRTAGRTRRSRCPPGDGRQREPPIRYRPRHRHRRLPIPRRRLDGAGEATFPRLRGLRRPRSRVQGRRQGPGTSRRHALELSLQAGTARRNWRFGSRRRTSWIGPWPWSASSVSASASSPSALQRGRRFDRRGHLTLPRRRLSAAGKRGEATGRSDRRGPRSARGGRYPENKGQGKDVLARHRGLPRGGRTTHSGLGARLVPAISASLSPARTKKATLDAHAGCPTVGTRTPCSRR